MITHKKNGQVWTMDYLIGLILFIIVILITIKVAFLAYPSQDHILVYRDAVHLSDSILLQGYPSNWTNTTVLVPGVGHNNRINNTLLSNFKTLNYYQTKTLLHIKSDYIFFIHNDTTIINTGQCVYGYNIATEANCTPILSAIKYANLVKINRLIIYNSTVMVMTFYTWN